MIEIWQKNQRNLEFKSVRIKRARPVVEIVALIIWLLDNLSYKHEHQSNAITGLVIVPAAQKFLQGNNRLRSQQGKRNLLYNQTH